MGPALDSMAVKRQYEFVVSGAREHNLRDLHLSLPRNALIVITGLSGSGKSSLAFDTIYAEGALVEVHARPHIPHVKNGVAKPHFAVVTVAPETANWGRL